MKINTKTSSRGKMNMHFIKNQSFCRIKDTIKIRQNKTKGNSHGKLEKGGRTHDSKGVEKLESGCVTSRIVEWLYLRWTTT